MRKLEGWYTVAGLKIQRIFTKEGTSPYEMFEYDTRDSIIKNPDGRIIFEIKDVEVPKQWSQLATDILAQKYIRKAGVPQRDANGFVKKDKEGQPILGSETSIKQVVHRLAGCWRHWGEHHGYFASEQDAQVFYDEIAYMLLNQSVAPNSPQWFNTGLSWAYDIKGNAQGHFYVDHESGEVKQSVDAYTRPQPHACAEYHTQVYTAEGIKYIGEIVDENMVGLPVFDGEKYVKILATKDNGIKENYRIQFKNGNYIDLTEDHLVLSSKTRRKEGGKYDWNEVKKLRVGDRMQQPLLLEVSEKNVFTEDLAKARLAGWITGDGSVGIYQKVMRLEIITVNNEEHDAVLADIKEVFGENVSYWVTDFVTESDELSGKRIHLSGKKIHEFVKEYELHKRSNTVNVSKRILSSSAQERREYLKALFQADGCVRIRVDEKRNAGDICLSTISEELSFGVLQLLNSLGIYSRIALCKDSREDRKTQQQVIISYGSAREQFYEQVGFLDSNKNGKLKLLNKLVTKSKTLPLIREEQITSISSIGSRHVYDIETESHKFLGNGMVVHNCFIQSVRDDLVNPGGIFDLAVREARIFKYGSGTGSNFSNLRGKGEPLSGGGTSSGLMSFLKLFDAGAGAIKSGGTTRRAAKMVSLDMDHPEIEEFVMWKYKEEQKVADLVTGSQLNKRLLQAISDAAKKGTDWKTNNELKAAIAQAKKLNVSMNYILRVLQMAEQGIFDVDFKGFDTHYESEAYQTVSGQNANNSVRAPTAFFEALKNNEEWNLIRRTDGSVHKTTSAKELWERVCLAAWHSADPGLQYHSTINEWHTCPADGPIRGSNPCVTGDTLVLTKGGRWKRIDSLLGEETELLVNPGEILAATTAGSFKTGNKPVYLLTTKSGYEIKLTADHRVFTVNRGWVQACELTQDDHVMLPKNPVANIDESDDSIFYQMLGVYLGDGCGKPSKSRGIQLTMSKQTELPILQRFSEYVAENYDRATHKNSPATVLLTKTSGKFTITNTTLINRFSQLLDLSLTSHQKKLSEQVFGLSLGEQKYLLQGLFTADGTVANYGEKSQYVALDSTSLQLLKDVQVLLLGFGIKSKLYKNRRAGKDTALLPDGNGNLKEYPVREMHSLRITRSSRMRFEELINFMEESPKREQLRLLNSSVSTYEDKPTDPVDSLTYIGEKEVYDLTEPMTSSFVANGMVVHNCSEYMFLDDTACNLASLNMVKFLREDGKFDVAAFRHGCRLMTMVLEISVLMAQFPSEEIARLSYKFRTLGLGYANIGSALMRLGIAYDSDEARTYIGALTAIMHGQAYLTSSEMAAVLGPFPGYEKNKEHMLRVMRNHRRAAYNVPAAEYEGLSVTPMGIDSKLCPEYLLSTALKVWDENIEMGKLHGYRNAQVTVIAPTGTIGLVMDCDTTGIEPDFAIVKFKKLAGGGYFKIINQSVPAALKNLGYSEEEIDAIVKYAVGHGTLKGSPAISHSELKEKGFTDEIIERAEKQLASAFDITFVFNRFTLGDSAMEELGFSKEQYEDETFNTLAELGFSKEKIEKANEYVCGTMTVEGAPLLKDEHLPVFDCANKCGRKGKRFLHYMAHIKAMAAAQPFISGAISKTINMPNEATIQDISDAYLTSWQLCLKANALYRDGSKLSQPLNTVAEDLSAFEEEDVDEVSISPESVQTSIAARMAAPEWEGVNRAATIVGNPVAVSTYEYEDGTLGGVQLQMLGKDTEYQGLLNAYNELVSFSLQHGVPLQKMVDRFTFSDFAPGGPVMGDTAIKNTTSPVDYMFRVLGHEYLGRSDLVHVKEAVPARTNEGRKQLSQEERAIAEAKAKGYTGEKCPSCTSMRLKRNGTCALCEDCGSTTGCS